MYHEIARRAFEIFQLDATESPPLTLRGGNAIDSYSSPPPYDAQLDQPTDEYLELYHWGITFLDPISWQYYLPYLMAYAIRNLRGGTSMVIHSVLSSLRPPDQEPPRLASLSQAQEQVIVSFLDVLAFDEQSQWQAYALQAMEEYWLSDALYRRQR
jgi:hypothetical protein